MPGISRRDLLKSSAAVALNSSMQAQQPESIRLIVQGDDMAAAHAINVGTIRAYKEGILRTANVIVPGPWFLHTVKLVNENPGLDIGVHLAVTSEWSYIKWRPVTHAASLVEGNGYFLPNGSAVREAKPKFEDVERELRAQIEMARRHIPQISYFSAHMGFDSIFPEWKALVQKLAAEHNVHLVGKDPQIRSLGRVWTNQPFDPGAVRAEKLASRLETLAPGLWRLLDHLSEDDPEMRAISHPGYENVAADRAANLAAFTSPKVTEVVRKRNIQLIGYRDLH